MWAAVVRSLALKRLAAVSFPLAPIACSDDDGDSDSDPVSACEIAVDQGGNAGVLVDASTSFDAAIEVCPRDDALVAATDRFPNALGGQDPATVVAQRCAAGVTGAPCDGVEDG